MYRLYKLKRGENLVEALRHFNIQDVRCCPCFMDNVLEALHSHKHYFTERWIYDNLLSFIGRLMQNFTSNERPMQTSTFITDIQERRFEATLDQFSSFEEMCVHAVLLKLLEDNAEKENICNKVLEKRWKRLYNERHLPSLFVNDLIRSISDARIMMTATLRKKSN
jgi:hypothetical protein